MRMSPRLRLCRKVVESDCLEDWKEFRLSRNVKLCTPLLTTPRAGSHSPGTSQAMQRSHLQSSERGKEFVKDVKRKRPFPSHLLTSCIRRDTMRRCSSSN